MTPLRVTLTAWPAAAAAAAVAAASAGSGLLRKMPVAASHSARGLAVLGAPGTGIRGPMALSRARSTPPSRCTLLSLR